MVCTECCRASKATLGTQAPENPNPKPLNLIFGGINPTLRLNLLSTSLGLEKRTPNPFERGECLLGMKQQWDGTLHPLVTHKLKGFNRPVAETCPSPSTPGY